MSSSKGIGLSASRARGHAAAPVAPLPGSQGSAAPGARLRCGPARHEQGVRRIRAAVAGRRRRQRRCQAATTLRGVASRRPRGGAACARLQPAVRLGRERGAAAAPGLGVTHRHAGAGGTGGPRPGVAPRQEGRAADVLVAALLGDGLASHRHRRLHGQKSTSCRISSGPSSRLRRDILGRIERMGLGHTDPVGFPVRCRPNRRDRDIVGIRGSLHGILRMARGPTGRNVPGVRRASNQTCTRLGAVSYSYRGPSRHDRGVQQRVGAMPSPESSSSGDDVSVLTVWTGALNRRSSGGRGASRRRVSRRARLRSNCSRWTDKGRTTALRTVFERAEGHPAGGADPIASFHADAIAYVAELLDVPETGVRRHSFNPFETVTDREAMV